MSDATRQTLDNWYAAIKSGDPNALRALMGDTITVDYPAPEGALPWSGLWQGPDAVMQFFAIIKQKLTVENVTLEESHFTENAAMTIINGRWTVNETGKTVSARAANLFLMSDHKIDRYQVFNDTAAFAVGLNTLRKA